METKQSFSLRKLSVGLASVLIGISFLNGTKANVVKADTEESPKENVQDAQDKNNEDMQSAILKNTSSPNADVQNTTQTDNTNVNKSVDSSTSAVRDTSAVQDASADQVGQVAGAERGDSSARETRTSQLNTNNANPAVLTKLALNPSRTKTLSLQSLNESKIAANTTNGGFDEATWGKLDVNNWTGQAENGVYQLTGYTGDLEHIIVPNSADFATAGKDIGNLQVGIDADTTHSWFEKGSPKTIAFSKTGDQKVKAVGTDWTSAFTGADSRHGFYEGKSHELNKFDGNNLDVSNVTDMYDMFYNNQLGDLNGLANWKIGNVTSMGYMLNGNKISDLSPLANWKTDNVTNMSWMFFNNKISDLSPLSNWKTDNVTNMYAMLSSNQINDLSPLTNWKTDNVTDMSYMFESNQISDLRPLANWKTDNVTDMSYMFESNQISDLRPLANWKTDNVTNMSNMFNNNKINDLNPLANWKTDNVTNMSYMFQSNQISDLRPLANWKTDNVTNMSNMFFGNQISDLSPLANWKTDSVTDMSAMFYNNKISDLNGLANWKINNVTSMYSMFDYNQIKDLSSLANWKTDNVTNMGDMFENNKISDLSPLANWKTDNVTDMYSMFNSNQISNLSPLANWKTDNVTNMSYMFQSNQISDLRPLANWKTDNVTNMSNMFFGNQISDLSPLANWKIDNVTNMGCMFYNNKISDLNGLANWQINNVTSMYSMFDYNQIKDLSSLANWKTDNVTNMGSMFENNKISDLSPLANWKTDKVTDMSWMFQNNKISDLSPLANWKTDNVTDMGDMFYGNKISDLSLLADWKTDKVTDMAYMFDNNPIQYADFTKWNFDQVKYFGNFIKQNNYAIILVKNAQDQSKLAGKSQESTYSSDLYPVVNVPSNNLHFGDTDTSSMPTILIATNKPEVRQQLLSLINAKVSDYQKSHPDDTVTPAVPLDNLIELADLANAKFNVVPKVTIVTVHFIDDTDNLHAPKDYQLANQKMNTTLNSSSLKDDQDLANFKFASDPVFTVTSLNPNWTVHLVHELIEVTDPNQLQTTSTRTIVFNLPDKPETIVQTIGYKRTGMQDLITKQITYTNWVFNASRSNVTVDQQLSSLYAAYDPNSVSKDGTLVNFAPIKIPTKAGYKPVLQTVRPNMLSFIFMPVAKPPVEVNLDTPEKFSANDATVSLLPTWHLVENNMPNYTYTLTNTINSLNLPKIKDYKLYLVNKDSHDNSVAFTYLKDNNLKYLFKITFRNDSFEFSVKNVDKDVIRVYKFNNLKDLDKFLVKFVTAA